MSMRETIGGTCKGDGGALDGYGALLTVEEVAELLSVSTRTVYRFVRQGDLPCVRVGHRIYFTRTAMIERLGLTA